MKLYVLKDGLYHYCKVNNPLYYSYMYKRKGEFYFCLECGINFPVFLALGFKIRIRNNYYMIGNFKEIKFFKLNRLKSIDVSSMKII